MNMTSTQIMAAARKLKEDRFSARNTMLKERADERYNRTEVEIPSAYQKTTRQPTSNIIDDEGRQVATLVYAVPTPHQTPPTPEDQPLTTKVEQFLIAAQQELEDNFGPVWWQCTLAQVHDNIGWIYTAPKKVAYAGQPKPPKDADFATQADYDLRNERFKRDAGISAVFDYQYAVTGTVMHKGPVFDPHCVYVWKETPVVDLKSLYGVQRDAQGYFNKTEPGYMMDSSKNSTVTIVEYWDKEECVIVVEDGRMARNEAGQYTGKDGYELTRWKHNFGRVPYFARPAFVTEQLDEDKCFAGPLDGLYVEVARYKRLLARLESVSYQTAFAPLKITTKEGGETIVDDNGTPLVFLELEPGKARQLAPGQDVMPVAQSPEVQNLYAELAECRQTIERYILSPISKGVPPGADTSNAALSNLHQFQLSTLTPLAEQTARQARAIFRFWLEQIRKIGETVFVLDKETDAYLSLNSVEIVSVNVQAKATPDQGQQQLLIEKHAVELWQIGAITEMEMHEMRGKESPEEYVEANMVERLRKTLEPVVLQQIVTDLGMMDAVNQMMQANAQTGSARNAIPALEQQASALDAGELPTGMGSGSPGQPRTNGVRMPPEAINTQRAQSGGY